MNKQDKIDKLQEQIWKLKEEILKESRAKYLPEFIKNSKIYYDGISSFGVEMSEEFKNKLIKECGDEFDREGHSYHFKIEFDEELVLYFDDGYAKLSFQLNGKTSDYLKQLVQKCKKYGIKLDFSREKVRLKANLARLQKEYDRLDETAKLFEI